MRIVEIVFIALALSIDAFAVSVAAAATGRINGRRAAFRLSFHFGLFQFLMPVLGWAAGTTLEPVVRSFDHWVAFGLLTAVGVRMLRSDPGGGDRAPGRDPSRGLALVALSTAVSIDALAVGLTLAMLRVSVWGPSVVVGVVTAAAALLGIHLGSRLRVKIGRIAEVIGGAILILIGVNIIASHLSVR